VVTRKRLFFGLLMHIAWTTGLIATPVAVQGQYSLPEFTLPSPPKGATAPSIDKLKVKGTAASSIAGREKSRRVGSAIGRGLDYSAMDGIRR
jgi:hypothetical protein